MSIEEKQPMKRLISQDKYQEICKVFSLKKCIVLSSFDDVSEQYKFVKCPSHLTISFTASCGHFNTVTYINFKYKCSGVICKQCTYNITKNKLRVEGQRCLKENDCSRGHFCEHNAFMALQNIMQVKFNIIKCVDGALADFMIRSKETNVDLYQPIQLKSTENQCHKYYTFSIHKNKYKNALVICHCLNKDCVWIFGGNELSHLKNVNISDTSPKYNPHKVLFENLNQYLLDFMDNNKHLQQNQVELDIPITVAQIQEQKYISIRCKHLPNIPFTKPTYEHCAYDFTILDLKIQEKVAVKVDRKNGYNSFLLKNGGRCDGKRTQIPYSKGDHDFYWIHLVNTTLFYVIPEEELCCRGYLSDENNKGKKNLSLSINSKNWYTKFQFDYENDVNENEKRILAMVNLKKML